MSIRDRIKSFFDIVDGRKAIGAGFQTVGTVMPPTDQFLHFLSIASEEDSPRYITVKNPYLDNSWVFAATRVMAENFAMVPFRIMQGDTEIEPDGVKYGWVRKLFDTVSPYMNKYSLFESIPVWLTLRGECFWRIIRSELGSYPAQLRVLQPECMEERIDGYGEIIQWVYHSPKGGSKENIDPKDIIQFKYFNPFSRYRGLSPLTASLLGLHIDIAASAYNFYFFNNNSTPAGVLSVEQDMTTEEADGIEGRWNKKQRGLKRSGKVAVLGKGAKYLPIALAQKDIQYLEQKKWSREEVFAVLNVPPALCSVLEFASIKSNIKEQKKQLYETNLIPKMRFTEAVLDTEFFDREKMKDVRGRFDIDSIDALQVDFAETVTQAKELNALGFTANEINERLKLGFEPKPWRDIWWIQYSMVPAGETPPEKGTEPKKMLAQKARTPNRERIWRMLQRRADVVEGPFMKALQDYFYRMRQAVLENVLGGKSIKIIESSVDDLMFSESEFDQLLTELGRVHIEAAYLAGLESLRAELNTTFELTSQRAAMSVARRIEAITEINETMREQLLTNFQPVIQRGLREGLSYEQISRELSEVARNQFNLARSRARTIARTEVNGAMSQARFDTMDESGIKKHQWTTAMIGKVRDSHLACEAQVREIGEMFDCGLLYPLDPSGPAEEVVNCRCITVPYIEEGQNE